MSKGRWLQVELLSELFSNTIDRSVTFTAAEDTSLVVSDARIKLSAALQEIRHVHWLVNGALVDDGCFMNGVSQGNSSVNAMSVVHFSLDNGLSDMVHMMVSGLVDTLAQINDSPLFW